MEIKLSINSSELEVLNELLVDNIKELKNVIKESVNGSESITEYNDFNSEFDVEYYLDLMEGMGSKIKSFQSDLKRNQVRYVEQDEMFRVEQKVTVYQVSGNVTDQLVYVFESRHGSYFIYFTLESLVASFTRGKESELHFSCEKEVEYFLCYWQG